MACVYEKYIEMRDVNSNLRGVSTGVSLAASVRSKASVSTAPPESPFLFLEELEIHDPIPKAFAYFIKQSGKTTRYSLTPKRHRMATKRWKEEEKYQLSKGISKDKLRQVVSASFRHVINELVDSKYHQENGYVEWEQLFRSPDAFEKWLDRYEHDYAEHQNEPRKHRSA